MSFELHITSSKDIDKLKIDFSDGTSVITSNKESDQTNKEVQQVQQVQKAQEETVSKSMSRDQYLNTDIDYGTISNEIVEKPVINMGDRPLKVADELQNLDI